MKLTMTRHRDKWWKFWISKKPKLLKEGKDYELNDSRLTIKRNFNLKDQFEVEYEYNAKLNQVR